MLVKLIKHEFKATSRTLLSLYVVLLAVTLINKLINPFEILRDSEGFNFQILLNVMSVIIYIAIIFAVMASTFVTIIQRFYKNLLGNEGYLTFTLPVETWQHIMSKMIVSIIWLILSIVVIFASILIISGAGNFIREFIKFLDDIETILGKGILIILPTYILSALLLIILTIYNSISIGHQFQNHKILASFAMAGAFYLLTQAILVITFLIFAFIHYGGISPSQFNSTEIPNGNILFGVVTIILLIISVGHFISANYMLKNRLNLE
ncbi:MAG TPA: hypothetical protein GXZ78_01030 [Eubacteriaceae bacterium]|nr:hypothetical protein [Eubacteriaceae bacterium]